MFENIALYAMMFVLNCILSTSDSHNRLIFFSKASST